MVTVVVHERGADGRDEALELGAAGVPGAVLAARAKDRGAI